MGVAGGGLVDAGWAANEQVADVGRRGEERTAEVLDRAVSPGGATVLHDLMLPVAGVKANVDHVVVSGRHVSIIDTKCWKPGRYWTFRGHTRRGWTRVDHADKRSGPAALRHMGDYLATYAPKARLDGITYVIWPSSKAEADRLSVRWYRPQAGRAMTGERFARKAGRLVGSKPADTQIVDALLPLVMAGPSSARPAGGQGNGHPPVSRQRQQSGWAGQARRPAGSPASAGGQYAPRRTPPGDWPEL